MSTTEATTRAARDERGLVGAIGSVTAIVVAGALVPVRDSIDNANVALVLVVVIVAAAIVGGRMAGAVTSLSAALAFNFFHTVPYRTLRITDGQDIVTVLLLLAVGLVVGELAQLGARSRRAVTVRRSAERHLEVVAALLAQQRPLEEVWAAVKAGLVDGLALGSCTFEPRQSNVSLPRLERTGQIAGGPLQFAAGGFALPTEGVELTVERAGRPVGRLVLVPAERRGVSIDERRAAIALADGLAVALPDRPIALD